MKILLFIFLAIVVNAQEMVNVTLSWDANPEPDISHYRVYVGTVSQTYSPYVLSGEPQKVLSLPVNVLHFAVVTAVNTSGLESIPSKEICFQVFLPGEGKAPSQPAGLKKVSSVSVTLEKSSDLQIWQTMYTEVVTASLSEFYRVNLAPQ